MATHTHTRRAMFGAMAIAPVVIAAPAFAHAARPSEFRLAFDANLAAEQRYNNLGDLTEEQDEVEYQRASAAWDRMANAQPSTWAEFVEKYDHFAKVGYDLAPDEIAKQMREARHLVRAMSS